MKAPSNFILLALIAVTFIGCGRKIKQNGSQSYELERNVQCSLAEQTNLLLRELAPDHDIKLHLETIYKVQEEMKLNREFKPKKFWSTLTPAVRDLLNFELNLQVVKNRGADPEAVYQSTALFFAGIRNVFNEKLDYKIKDKNSKIYSFKARGVTTTGPQLINYDCGHFQKTDLSQFEVGPEVLRASDLLDVFECRSLFKSLVLMEIRGTSFLMAGKSLIRLNSSELVKKSTKRRVELTYDTEEVTLSLKIQKKRELKIEDWTGKRAIIDLRSPEYAMDEKAACHSLMRAF